MTVIHPAVAYAPGVVPEPLAEPAKLIQFLRLLRDNQLSVYTRDSFATDFGEARLFFHNFVLVNEPDFIEHILVTNHQNYVKGHLTRQMLEPALGNSLLISEGDFWRRQRRIMAPAFHHQHLAQAAHVMVRRARQRVERWRTSLFHNAQREAEVVTARNRSLTCVTRSGVAWPAHCSGSSSVKAARSSAFQPGCSSVQTGSPCSLPTSVHGQPTCSAGR